jgi:hypothetical protein
LAPGVREKMKNHHGGYGGQEEKSCSFSGLLLFRIEPPRPQW